MNTRLKFRVASKRLLPVGNGGVHGVIALEPMLLDGVEHIGTYEPTHGGGLTFTSEDEKVLNEFEVDAIFLIDFTPVAPSSTLTYVRGAIAHAKAQSAP